MFFYYSLICKVEPLHFTCHAASDGTKMEKIDLTGSTLDFTSLESNVTNNGVSDINVVTTNYVSIYQNFNIVVLY